MVDEINNDQLQSIGIISRVIRNDFNRALKPYGLNDSNYFFIFFIEEHPNSSQDDLTRNMFLNHSTIARSVAKLVDLGYIEKRLDDKDHRTTRLFLTEKGDALRSELHDITTRIYNSVFSNLNEEERSIVMKLLSKTSTHLEEERAKK